MTWREPGRSPRPRLALAVVRCVSRGAVAPRARLTARGRPGRRSVIRAVRARPGRRAPGARSASPSSCCLRATPPSPLRGAAEDVSRASSASHEARRSVRRASCPEEGAAARSECQRKAAGARDGARAGCAGLELPGDLGCGPGCAGWPGRGRLPTVTGGRGHSLTSRSAAPFRFARARGWCRCPRHEGAASAASRLRPQRPARGPACGVSAVLSGE